MSKYKGIDEREFKCCDNSDNTIEAGISFDALEDGTNVLRFHFLDYVDIGTNNGILDQRTKTMYLDKSTISGLIEKLKSLDS